MRALEIANDRSVQLVSREDPPSLAADEVRIGIRYSGICGSDLHLLNSEMAPPGLVLGHEFSGVITEVGAAVDGFGVGERVTVVPVAPCGHCRSCTVGESVCLEGLQAGPGLGRAGGYADSVVVPDVMVRRLPDSVSDVAGALAEPLAVAVRGVAHGGADPDAPVAVLGAGPIGFMTVVALQARGFTDIVAVDPNEARRKKVEALGVTGCAPAGAADSVPAGLRAAPRVVFDCTGHPSGVPLGLEMLPQAGSLIVVGVPFEPITTDFFSVATRELRVQGSLAYQEADFAEALEHLAAGRVPVDAVVTSIVALDEAWSSMQDLASGRSQHVKVLLKP